MSAQPIFVKWLMAHEKRVAAEDSPLMAEHLSKYRKLVPALALIFYLIDVASKPTPPPTKPTKSRAAPRRELRIGKGHVLLALRWAAVLETHARRIYLMGTDYRVAAAKSLAKKIEAGEVSDGFTARDVYRSGWTNLVDSELVKEACDELEDAHWLRRMENTPGGRGRPPKEARYEINPAVLAGQGVVPTKLTKGRGRTRS
jgi:putative DNA primase/helicase